MASRQGRGQRDRPGTEVYQGLRSQALSIPPSSIGLPAEPGSSEVFGVIMDTTYKSGTATLAVFADGAVSLYFSTGGGIIGEGTHEHVAAAARQLLRVAEPSGGHSPAPTMTACQRLGTPASRCAPMRGR